MSQLPWEPFVLDIILTFKPEIESSNWRKLVTMLIKSNSLWWVEHSCHLIKNTEITLSEISMMPWVDISHQTSKKLCNFLNKVNKNVLESPFKPDLISVKKDIFLTCFHMVVPESKLVFSQSTKILPETPTEDIPSRLSRKLLLWPKTALIKLLLIWCQICRTWVFKEILKVSKNFSKILILDLMESKFIQL